MRLKRVLTPELHETLLAARSSAGSDLTCVIRSGVALPSDGVGAFAADADCLATDPLGVAQTTTVRFARWRICTRQH